MTRERDERRDELLAALDELIAVRLQAARLLSQFTVRFGQVLAEQRQAVVEQRQPIEEPQLISGEWTTGQPPLVDVRVQERRLVTEMETLRLLLVDFRRLHEEERQLHAVWRSIWAGTGGEQFSAGE